LANSYENQDCCIGNGICARKSNKEREKLLGPGKPRGSLHEKQGEGEDCITSVLSDAGGICIGQIPAQQPKNPILQP
jgi:hypothetical protein